MRAQVVFHRHATRHRLVRYMLPAGTTTKAFPFGEAFGGA